MAFKSGILNTAILAIILIVVLFQSYAEIMPEAQDSGDTLGDEYQCETAASTTCFYNASRAIACTENNETAGDTTVCTSYEAIPLGGVFSGTGVIFVVVMAALLILVVKAFLHGGKK